jgi:hypothetical protein
VKPRARLDDIQLVELEQWRLFVELADRRKTVLKKASARQQADVRAEPGHAWQRLISRLLKTFTRPSSKTPDQRANGA